MTWHWHDRRDPIRRLLGRDVEYTPQIAKALCQIARERTGEAIPELLINGLSNLHLKELRNDLADRLEQHEREIAEAKRESWRQLDDRYQAQAPPAWRPTGDLVVMPGGAIVDAGANEIDAAAEQARAQSLAARAETERIEREHELAEQRAREQYAAAAAERELPRNFLAS